MLLLHYSSSVSLNAAVCLCRNMYIIHYFFVFLSFCDFARYEISVNRWKWHLLFIDYMSTSPRKRTNRTGTVKTMKINNKISLYANIVMVRLDTSLMMGSAPRRPFLQPRLPWASLCHIVDYADDSSLPLNGTQSILLSSHLAGITRWRLSSEIPFGDGPPIV